MSEKNDNCHIHNKYHFDIGCFGSIRPLKNQLSQALAAIKFADENNLCLFFNINGTRTEQRGNEVLKNIRSLFEYQKHHKLIEHEWLQHHDFINLVSKMDMGLQVSFSETFNIVTADFVCQGVPIIVSPEIEWMPKKFKADPNSIENIVKVMNHIYKMNLSRAKRISRSSLVCHNKKSLYCWLKFLED
jgi:hypothetical protein